MEMYPKFDIAFLLAKRDSARSAAAIIVGLTRAFIYAGTPSVITTLWKVNDRASYELMSAFYSNLKTMTKSEALRQAQLKTMKEFPQPFFWAPYGLTGEP